MKYVCTVCGWVYDEDEAGVKWEDLRPFFLYIIHKSSNAKG